MQSIKRILISFLALVATVHVVQAQDETIVFTPQWTAQAQFAGFYVAEANGSLLILAPWDLDAMGSVGSVPADSEYSRFHNLNTLAAEICAFDGAARILG